MPSYPNQKEGQGVQQRKDSMPSPFFTIQVLFYLWKGNED